jgi:prolyl 4-hydroxylase
MPQKIIKKLKCYYLNHNPLLSIAPIKAEKIHLKPEIWIYHEFITNEQIETMKNLANPKVIFTNK